VATDLDDALRRWIAPARQAPAVGRTGGQHRRRLPELVRRGIPDLVTDQTSAHDPLTATCPRPDLAEAAHLRTYDPVQYVKRAHETMAIHVEAMVALKGRGAHVFDYGNNLRAGAKRPAATSRTPSPFPGFVPAYIRPLFCEGKGPFRWAALSGDPRTSR
jgi:urocanate hydratase